MSDLKKLVHALSSAAGQSSDSVTNDVIVAAEAHGVAKLLHDLQHEAGNHELPQQVSHRLLEIARQHTAIEMARMLGIRQVLTSLNAAGIPVLLLKGSALAYWLYENPAQRSRCDLDILVADIGSAKRATAALQKIGYSLSFDAADESAEFEVALEGSLPGGVLNRVDLHWRLLNHAQLADGLRFADLEASAISISALACDARGLDCANALLHALLHRITNMASGQHNRLIWLYDIHLLALRCRDPEWTGLLNQADRLHCATACLDGLRATRDVFNTSLPESVDRTLETQSCLEGWRLGDGLDQGAMDRAHLRALRWPEKMGWLRRKFFPSRQFMRYRYSVVGVAGFCKAYVGRWWTGLMRAVGRGL